MIEIDQCPYVAAKIVTIPPKSLIALILTAIPFSHAANGSAAAFEEKLWPGFEQHCVKCHGRDGKVKGKVNLLELSGAADLLAEPGLLEKMIVALEDREMPPEDEPELAGDTRQAMIEQLEAMLEKALADEVFAATPIRRMNRLQYNNAVIDLLELEREIFQLNERLMRRYEDYFHPETGQMPPEVKVASRPLSKDIDGRRPEGFRGVAAFPQDMRAEHGFDNRADHLTLSPLLMESFLTLSQTIMESTDLMPEECGSWNWLFASPAEAEAESEAIRARLAKLLRRGFRRPADPETLERFARFAEGNLAAGASFEETMRTAVGAVLAAPDFLYFYETPGVGARVDDYELASRLALLFWASIPDDKLLDAADSADLSDPEVLSDQIDRMMNDPRSSRFCDAFPAQWLQLDRLITAIPDPKKYPYFYYNGYRVSMHMMLEPLLLFETVYLENRPIIELLDPGFTWESDMLAANYEGRAQGGGVNILNFKRVPLDDPRRGGVITNAAVMTMTSTPVRTQPITRGAWVNAVIFNEPPDPPPADIPALPEVDEARLETLTIRERLAEHRKREDCAGCHNKIDPLGFALENYGPTGVWRDTYENGRPVDPSGVLFNQHEFATAQEFKQLLVREKRRFYRGFVAHLLSYGLGRELGPADSPAVAEITERAMAGEDSLRTVLKRVAMSEPFLHKNPQPPINHEN